MSAVAAPFQRPGIERVARECREPIESTADFKNREGRRRRPRSGALDGGDRKQSTSNSDTDTAQSRIIAQLRLRPPVQTQPYHGVRSRADPVSISAARDCRSELPPLPRQELRRLHGVFSWT